MLSFAVQIGQVIRELKRSSYKPSMAILAARKHSCINTAVKKKPSIDEVGDGVVSLDQGDRIRYRNTQLRFM